MKIPILTKYIEKRTSELIQAFLRGEDINTPKSSSGIYINDTTAMQISTFWACVKKISEDVATLPWHVYKKLEKGKEKAENHPLYDLLLNVPNPEMTTVNLIESFVANTLCWGKGYIQIVRNNAGEIIELWPLLSRHMKPMRDKNTKVLYFEYKAPGDERIFSQDELWFMPGLSFNGIDGLSVISFARESLGLSKATEQYGAMYFGNGARPGGVIEVPEGIVIKNKEDVRKEWEKTHQGANEWHTIGILDLGMKYHQIGLPPEDSQFLETRSHQVLEICRWFNMQPSKVGYFEKGASYASIEQQNIGYVIDTLRPWIVRGEKSCIKCLLSRQERRKIFIKANMDALLRGDFKARMDGYAIAKNNGLRNSNDIAELEDWNPIPEDQGGDVYMVNGNYIPMSMVGKQWDKGGESVGNSNTTNKSNSGNDGNKGNTGK